MTFLEEMKDLVVTLKSQHAERMVNEDKKLDLMSKLVDSLMSKQ